MKKQKLLVLAGALLIGSGALVGCGKKAPTTSSDGGQVSSGGGQVSQQTGPIKLTVWSPAEDQEFMEEAIARFEAANIDEEYEFTFDGVSEADAVTKVTQDINTAADVFHFAGDQLVPLTDAGALFQIPSAFANRLGMDEGVLKAGQVEEEQYGIPFTPNTYFMYYDADVYTAEEVKDLDVMLAKDVAKYDYNIAIDLDNGWYGQSFFYSAGATMANTADPKANFQGNTRAAVDKIYELATNNKVVNDGGAGKFGAATGGCAAFISGTWDAPKADSTINWNAAALPQMTMGGKKTPWKAVGDYKMIGVNSVSKNPSKAAKFVAFLSTPEIQTLRYEMRSTAPTNKTAIDQNPSLATNKAVAAQTLTLANTFAQPSVAYSANSFWSLWEGTYNSIAEAADANAAYAAFETFNAALIA